MDAPVVLNRLTEKLISIRVSDGTIFASPKSRIDDEVRGLIKAHKTELLAFIGASSTPHIESLQIRIEALRGVFYPDEDLAMASLHLNSGGDVKGIEWLICDAEQTVRTLHD
jgi:hypothetical protein